jgi:hypothetical protein
VTPATLAHLLIIHVPQKLGSRAELERFTKAWRSVRLFQGKNRRPPGGAVFRDFSMQDLKGVAIMGFAEKYFISPKKGVQRITSMALFRRPSSKRKNSRNLVKRYFRLIR